MKSKYDKIDWKKVQSDYNNGLTQKEILKKIFHIKNSN